MAQITIYLPDEVEKTARKAARTQGKSVSRWISDQITQSLDDRWSGEVLDAAGALPDFPSLGEIRKGYGRDSLREHLE